MKKLLIAILLLVSTQAFAQSYYDAVSFTHGTVNTYTGKYTWTEEKSIFLSVIIKNNIIFVDDNASSSYVLGRQTLNKTEYNGDYQIGWVATDEKGIACTVKFVKYKENGTFMLYVMYRTFALGYVLE